MKKKIKIAHLYYDLMNLYGESGNVKAFKHFVEKQGVNVEVHFFTIGDKIDFKKFDFYYIGAGSEETQKLVMKDLMKYKDEIIKAVDDGKMFLATGNAMELFGKKIRYLNGTSMECLNIFDYQSYEVKERLVSEIHYEYDKFPLDKGRYILGFKNCICNIVHNNNRMFKYANNFNVNNFFAMNFVGPVLIRNPYFTNLLVQKLFEKKNFEYTIIEEGLEFDAYHKYVDNFIINNKLD